MASHKNQHFVPRCYLRPFTLHGSGLTVNLYNIDKQHSIPNAAEKGQCGRNYFCGKDLLVEKLLQKSESLYADAVRKITMHGYALQDNERVVLRNFCVLQYSLTEAAAQRTALVQSDMADIVFDGNVPTNLRTSVKDAVQVNMNAFSDTARVISDLKVVLVKNRTDLSFITSDDPAILTNRWYIQSKIAQHRSFGLGSSGALFLLPITPKIFCVIYDGDVYSMPHDCGWIDFYKRSDVDLFNEHQLLNCAANIYFHEWGDAAYVDQLYGLVMRMRPHVRHELFVSILCHEDDWGKKYRVVNRSEISEHKDVLLHMKDNRPRPSHWPSLIRWRENKRVYSNGSGAGYVRRSQVKEGDGYRNIY
jgi:hypothetical protein